MKPLGSFLAPHFEAYFAYRDALGYRSRSAAVSVRLLDRYLAEQGVDSAAALRPDVVDGFLHGRPRRTPRSFNGLYSEIHCCLRWLVTREVLTASPLLTRRRRGDSRRPFLFDEAGIRALLNAAAQLRDVAGRRDRARIYRLIFLLLYGLGLRVGEAARLQMCDVDCERHILEIRNTKFGKDRWVPFGPKLATELEAFLAWRAVRPGGRDPHSPLFTLDRHGRRGLRPTTITRVFQQLTAQLSLVIPEGTRPPNPQCLRHSFAVGTLRQWLEAGVDPDVQLPVLSTFMGHVHPSSTAVYLTITDDLLALANRRFAAYAAPLLNEVSS